MLTFGSVCSGIEAASVAWHPLGWRATWLAEVDRAASEVLAHRFPDVPNYGDMTTLPARVRAREIAAPDILVGGTPCQSFSVAGLRGGLSDPRGQLTLAFIDLANAIDEVRAEDGLQPVIIVWENVPGVLNHADNPLGCFLAGLAGDDDALEPGPRPEPGRSAAYWTWDKKTGAHRPKWADAGCAAGPQRAIAWRTIDAQYFGLAQRRRRVFVVASARQGFDPAAVLLEFDGLRRDTAPSREAGEAPAGTLDARTDGGGFPGTDGACSGHVVPAAGPVGGGGPVPDAVRVVMRGSGPGYWTDDVVSGALRVGGDLESAAAILTAAPVPQWWDGREVSQTLDAVLHKGQTMPDKDRFPAVLHPVESVDYQNCSLGGDLCGTLEAAQSKGNRGQDALAPICFSSKDYGADAQDNLARVPPAVVYAIQERTVSENPDSGPQGSGVRSDGAAYTLEARHHVQAVCVTGSVTHTLKAEGFDASEDGTGRGQPIVCHGTQDPCVSDIAFTQGRNSGGENDVLAEPVMAVRRLLPVECERLQGFPDGWTLVPTGPKRKPAADGPRYKQLGNSMAVNCMRWIGERIQRELTRGHKGGPPLDDPFEELFA